MRNFRRDILTVTLVISAVSAAVSLGAGSNTPGEVQSSFESPNKVSEMCSLPRALDLSTASPNALSFVSFSEAEKKIAKKVCSSDFYDNRQSTDDVTAVVTCPKLNSTNPGIMLHELPTSMSRDQYLKQECPKPKRAGDLIAKFKQSISCSYTPSILSYPRVARMMKSEIEMPFTAYRGMDRKEHLAIAEKALVWAKNVSRPGDDLIYQTWRSLYASDLNPAKKGAILYTDGNKQIFGALIPELKGDEFYKEANGPTSQPRVLKFQTTSAFAAVSSSSPVSSWGESKNFADVAQKMILLRDMGDLIVLDTLLNQQDRFGNLHYRLHYVRMDEKGELDWKLLKTKKNSAGVKGPDPEQASELKAKGYVVVKRMAMIDNDCGVAKENKMDAAGVAQKVTHLHPDTYTAIQKLQKLAESGALSGYLKFELLFTPKDVVSVQANLKKLATGFKAKCLAGKLFLDADIAQHLGAKAKVDSKAFCQSL